jgi:hypothetical protein
MNKSAALFALCSLVVGGVGIGQPPVDPNSGYGHEPGYANPGFNPERSMFGPTGQSQTYGPNTGFTNYYYSDRDVKPAYYKPTMRYYGNGYTVSYRYVPVYRADIFQADKMGESSNFRTESFRLSPEEVATWGAYSPRVTVKDNSATGPRTAVTSIVHKKSSGRASTRSKTSGDNIPGIPGLHPSTTPAPDSSAQPAPGPKQ